MSRDSVPPDAKASSIKKFTPPLPRGYSIRKRFLYFAPPNDSQAKKVRVSSLAQVVSLIRDSESDSWGKLLTWKDADKMPHEYIMPDESSVDSPTTAVKPLLSGGLRVYDPRLFMAFIQQSRPKQRMRLVSRPGWRGEDTYVLPTGKTISAPTEKPMEIIKLATGQAAYLSTTAGTVESWRSEVGTLCEGNSRLIFSVSCAFAAYLLHITGEESGGFHFRGPSSKGKSKCLAIAASVTGMQVQTWRATGNGLEGVAAHHNDTLLCLDELGEINPADLGTTAYMLAGGQGKARMSKDAALKKSQAWRTLYLSTGELSLAEHMLSGGKPAQAGMEARMPDVPAVVEGGHGAFEDLHGIANGDTFAKKLTAAAQDNHGTAGVEFLLAVVNDIEGVKAYIKARRAKFSKLYVPEGADGQVTRVAGRFALVAATGELAIKWGIVPWERGAARKGVAKCFKAWLAQRGNTSAAEPEKMLEQVRSFLQSYGRCRFLKINKDGTSHATDRRSAINNQAGYIRTSSAGDEYVIFPGAWKSDICKGFSPGDVARELLRRGYMKADKQGRAPTSERMPNSTKPGRYYVINDSIFSEDAVASEAGHAR